ncbi:potassium transporter TrkA [Tychonema sp. LEGE 07203]|uniref:potassium transporter TrkA n=1 Tax=Tychonema sp. LEGE 07203 TaxID=1828671 RepID=UPI00187FEB26|nr:potassium transporter TrkA [Tychonema sp. LEGE 07203]MBE9094188.1 potassium transporter TrkA [Tychonema sp. LEGE 07203]
MSFAEPKLIQVAIQFNSSYCGMVLNAIALPSSCHCLGLAREGRVILASENQAIFWGDCILAVALNSAIAPELYFTLKKTHPVLWTSFRSPLPSDEKYLSNEDFLVQLCCKD